jgi:hypothetical protein
MRRYRRRRREGYRYVRIPLHATEIDDLIEMGRLNEEQRQGGEAVKSAVLGLIHYALDEIRGSFLCAYKRRRDR